MLGFLLYIVYWHGRAGALLSYRAVLRRVLAPLGQNKSSQITAEASKCGSVKDVSHILNTFAFSFLALTSIFILGFGFACQACVVFLC